MLFMSLFDFGMNLVTEVFPLQMEGVRLVVNKGLSNHFQVTLKRTHFVLFSTLDVVIFKSNLKQTVVNLSCCVSCFSQVSHTVTLSTVGDSGYRFGSTYVGSKQTGPAEVRHFLVMLIRFLPKGVCLCCVWSTE